MVRWILAGALGALLLLLPVPSQAQVGETIMKCQKSVKLAIACVVVDQGIAKVVDILWDDLIKCVLQRTETCRGSDRKVTRAEIAEIEADGIEWSKLREFMASLYKSDPPADDAQSREKIAASCQANYHPVCAHLGFPRRDTLFTDCSRVKSQRDCDSLMSCSWDEGQCARAGGTRELFKK